MAINFNPKAITDALYYAFYGYELKATPENLEWALSQENALKYTFKDKEHCKQYNIVQYAIKCQDLSAITTLIELGADLNECCEGYGNCLHYYVDCLKDDSTPSLELLNLLITKVSDINETEAGLFETPMEKALHKASSGCSIHWDVVEVFLKEGSRITLNEFTDNTPFILVRDAYYSWTSLPYGQFVLSEKHEEKLLENISQYLKLERKYNPSTDSGLTMKEFKKFSQNFKRRLASSIARLENWNHTKNLYSSLVTVPGVGDTLRTEFDFPSSCSHAKETLYFHLIQDILKYSRYFFATVPNEKFADYFEGDVVNTLTQLLEKMPTEQALFLSPVLHLLKKEAKEVGDGKGKEELE